MAVETFECQIARGQINRYLAGESFSRDGMRQLEEHVSTCEFCRAQLSERKQALQKMLGVTSPAPMAAVSPEAFSNEALAAAMKKSNVEVASEPAATEQAVKNQAISQIKSAVRKTKATAAETTKGSMKKPLIYCGLLIAVLSGMSYMTRSGMILGPRALDRVSLKPVVDLPNKPLNEITTNFAEIGRTLGEAIAPTEAMLTVIEPTDTAKVDDTATDNTSTDDTAEAAAITPIKKHHKTKHKTKVAKTRKAHRRHAAPLAADTVQIYDGNGKAVNENEG